MNRLAIATVIAATVLGAAYAQETTIPTQVLTTIPQNVTNYSKCPFQNFLSLSNHLDSKRVV